MKEWQKMVGEGQGGRCEGDILRTLTEEGKPGNESSFVSLSV